jgi:hypothetical protein
MITGSDFFGDSGTLPESETAACSAERSPVRLHPASDKPIAAAIHAVLILVFM